MKGQPDQKSDQKSTEPETENLSRASLQFLDTVFASLKLDGKQIKFTSDEFQEWEIQFLSNTFAEGKPPAEAIFAALCLFLMRKEGSLCLEVSPPGLSRFLPEKQAAPLAAFCQEYFSNDPGDQKTPIHTTDLNIIAPLFYNGSTGFLYFYKYYQALKNLESQLGRYLFNPSSHDPSPIKGIIKEILDQSPVRSGTEQDSPPIQYGERQKMAILGGLLSPFLLITGGPGTGKTTTVLQVLRALLRMGVSPEKIQLAAPTGRAARRLTESLHRGLDTIQNPSLLDHRLKELEAKTIHRLLGYSPGTGGFLHGPNNPLPASYLVVDEVSMVDLLLMDHLFRAVDPGKTGICFLGDPDQLPSVEAGSVLADMVSLLLPGERQPAYSAQFRRLFKTIFKKDISGEANPTQKDYEDRIVVLDRGHRSSGPIQDFAGQIIRGETDLQLPEPAKGQLLALDGITFLEEKTIAPDEVITDLVGLWTESAYDKKYKDLISRAHGDGEALRSIFVRIEYSRILTARRTGARGVTRLNKIAAGILDPEGQGFFAGCPIMIQRNDPTRDLYNGDTGVILPDGRGNLMGVFESKNGYRWLGLEGLPRFELAFATTIHKSQGSEYHSVLMILPADPEEKLLNREILYTGVTRTKRALTIFGSREVLEKTIRRKSVRTTGPFQPVQPSS